ERRRPREGERDSDEEKDELEDAVDPLFDAVFAELDRLRARLAEPDDAAHPAPPAPRWAKDEEDPPEPGFRWRYVHDGKSEGVQVTRVFDVGSLAAAGLAVGDRVVAINGKCADSPPRFGRAIETLAPDAPLAVEVVRGAEH